MPQQPEKAGAPAPVYAIESFISLFGKPTVMWWVKRDDIIIAKCATREDAEKILAEVRGH